ncbi:MAG: hypothetical protein O3B72_13405, partial [Proteobacteria bacterium]|nr:hypothetical protein [Pseudomonadota bacterium]
GIAVVISLDNLQWIDSASLRLLIELMGSDDLSGVLLMATLDAENLERDLQDMPDIRELLQRNPGALLLELEPLTMTATNRMISETLFRSEDETREFARLVHEKTGGNPLAIREFLIRIHKRQLLIFDRHHREWSWETPSIMAEEPSENVGLDLVNQLSQQDAVTKRLLQIASCIGIEFDLELLKAVSGLSIVETSSRLSEAIQKGYLLQVTPQSEIRDKRILFRFAHERIQQTAYGMIAQKDRRQLHGGIGNALLATLPGDTANRIFDVVSHLNNSFDLPDTGSTDADRLAELNLQAGLAAKRAAAYQQAFKYFRTAIAVLGQHAWVNYDKVLELHLEAANMAYLCGDTNQLDLLVNTMLEYARSPADRARGIQPRIRSLINNHDQSGAIRDCLAALTDLGIDIPTSRNPRTWLKTVKVLTRCLLLARRGELQLPEMTSEAHLAAMKLLMLLCIAAYLAGDNRISRYVLEMAHLSLKYGMAPESSFAFPALGSVLISYFGTIDFGYRLGKLALDNLRDDDLSLHSRTITLAYNFNLSWKDHLNQTLEPLARAYKLGMENDDIEYALIAAISGSANAFVLGNDLNSIESKLADQTRQARSHQQIPIYTMGAVYLQATRNLLNSSPTPWLLEGDAFRENDLLQFEELKVDDSALANLFITKLYIAVLFNRFEYALEFARQAYRHLNAVRSSPAIPFFRTFETLACINQLKQAGFAETFRLKLRIALNRRLLRKWAIHSPENIEHRFRLIEGELAAAEGNEVLAIRHFEQAMTAAEHNGYLNDLALIHERTGRFYFGRGKQKLALYFMRNALKSYKRWGAEGKIQSLQAEFADLNEATTQQDPGAEFMFGGDRSMLDLETVINASQVLAGEIVLENLLERLMEAALFNAGGHKASLIMSNGQQLSVEILTR